MIYTPTVLLTTNGYTSHLVPGFSDLIVPVRGEMSALVAPAAVRPDAVSKPLQCSYGFMGNANQTINQDDYLIQRAFSEVDGSGGQLMFGGGRSYAAHAGVGVSDDSHIDPPVASYLRRELNSLLDLNNDEEELQAQWEWSGIMGYSRDGHPWVGEVRDEWGIGGGKGLWISGGFTGHGMPNTWLCGKAVVELIMGPDEGIDLPSTYRLSEERIVKARTYDEVSVADSRI
jgi:glycine/D-amino acid oxidase-like deaminating enzyme